MHRHGSLQLKLKNIKSEYIWSWEGMENRGYFGLVASEIR